MSDKTGLFIIFTLAVLAAGFTNANAQELPLSIDAHTGKNFYEYGDSIGVSGKIKNYDADIHSGIPVTYSVLNPSGEPVSLGQTDPGQFGAFSFNFVARGNQFEQSGDYSIQIIFDSIESEIPMFFKGGEPEIEDVTPPVILQHDTIEIYAQGNDDVTMVTFEVMVTDDVDKSIKATCKPESGFLFGIGETVVKCTAKDSSENFATPMSFSVVVNSPKTSIPNWLKNVAEFWCQDKIDDASFVEGIQYLIDSGIIVIPATSERFGETQEVPQWVKNNACWWSEDSITDDDFASGIEYLVREGIILV